MLKSRSVKFTDATPQELRIELAYRIDMLYRELVWILRGQGALTPEKLKLMKQVKEYFHIPDKKHYLECRIAAMHSDLDLIACSVGAPNTDLSWYKEANKVKPPEPHRGFIDMNSYTFKLTNAIAQANSFFFKTKEKEATAFVDLEKSEFKKFMNERYGVDKVCDLKKEDRYNPKLQKAKYSKEKKKNGGGFYVTIVVKEGKERKERNESLYISQNRVSSTIQETAETSKKDVDTDKALMPPPPPPSAFKPSIPHSQHALKTSTFSPLSSVASSAQPEISPLLVGFSSPSLIVSESSSTLAPIPSPLVNKPTTIQPPASSTIISLPSSVHPPFSSSIVSPSPHPAPVPDSGVLPVTNTQPSSLEDPSADLSHPPALKCSTSNLSPSAPPSFSLPTLLPSSCTSHVSQLEPPTLLTNVTQTVQVSDKPLMSTCEVPSSQPIGLQLAPVLPDSEDIQFLALPDSLDSLPPLVIVPPPEPVIMVPHSSSFPEPVQASTFILPSGMSIQLKEGDGEIKSRKRTISESGGTVLSTSSAPKTLALSQLSKLTPVMVNATTLNSQGQMKISAISRITSSTQPNFSTSLASPAQKVIIVTNPAAKTALNMRPVNVPVSSVNFPILQKSGPRLQTVQASISHGPVKSRPKLVQAKSQPKSNPVLIPVNRPNLPPKQDNITVIDSTPVGKILPIQTSPAKILPKPQAQGGNVFLVNSVQGPSQKIGNAGPGYRMIQRGAVPEGFIAKGQSNAGAKQNVVIMQKSRPPTQTVTLTANTNTESGKKLIPNKFVVIQNPKHVAKPPVKPPPSIKATQKTTVTKQPPPPIATAKGNNVVVLDLSQEELNHNLSTATLAEILQASGIITSTNNSQMTFSHPVTTSSLISSVNLIDAPSTSNTLHDPNLSQTIQLEATDSPDQIFTIEPEELTESDLSFIMQDTADSFTSQVLMDTESSLEEISSAEVVEEDSSSFAAHIDSAVAVQHSSMGKSC